MSKKAADALDKNKTRDPDFINAEVAMKRAAQKAREKAKRAGSGVAVFKDGKIVEEHPTNS
ncbi:MAG: hypothetical protein C4531_06740 [Desulfurivibrio sp.]|nr:MAG: hypothetical protein C4531_06740 [Desulfurivibrio sp.]